MFCNLKPRKSAQQEQLFPYFRVGKGAVLWGAIFGFLETKLRYYIVLILLAGKVCWLVNKLRGLLR